MTDFDTESALLASELERELGAPEPAFPTMLDLTLRIKRAADDPASTLEQLTALIRVEPLLGARVLRLANSVAFNPWGREIASVPLAVQRIGFSSTRAIALAVAMEQMARDLRSPAMRQLAEAVWRHAIDVAAWAYAISRDLRVGNPDNALFCGLIGDIGQMLMITHAGNYPALIADQERFAKLVDLWNKRMTRAFIAALDLPAQILEALPGDIPQAGRWPPENLRDVLFVADLAATVENPFDTIRGGVRENLLEVYRFGVEAGQFEALVTAAAVEHDSLLDVLRG